MPKKKEKKKQQRKKKPARKPARKSCRWQTTVLVHTERPISREELIDYLHEIVLLDLDEEEAEDESPCGGVGVSIEWEELRPHRRKE